jgi:hypothetical protein
MAVPRRLKRAGFRDTKIVLRGLEKNTAGMAVLLRLGSRNAAEKRKEHSQEWLCY